MRGPFRAITQARFSAGLSGSGIKTNYNLTYLSGFYYMNSAVQSSFFFTLMVETYGSCSHLSLQ